MKKEFQTINSNSGFVGNYYNKYETQNIIEKYLINNYFQKLISITKKYSISDFIDVGCGEGKWLYEFSKRGFNCIGTDHHDSVLDLAKKNLGKINKCKLFKSNIYSQNFSEVINRKILDTGIKNIFFLEVLEHLHEPDTILKKFSKIDFKFLIISVPNEPLWRILNCCRLKYINNFGNTPGHINHFSYWKLKKKLKKYFKIKEIYAPIPFLITLVEHV